LFILALLLVVFRSLLAALTLLPALLAIFGRAAFWPSRTARGTGRPGWWGRIAGRVVAHPAATLALGLVFFGALATAVLGYRPAGVGATPGAPAGSDSAARQVPAIRAAVAAAARAAGASDYGIAGAAPAGYDVARASDANLLRVMPVAIIVIGLLLALVLRSLIAPLYLIGSVVISYLAAFGLSVLVFQEATGAGGLCFFIPFLMFVFLLALGEDYNILVMTRIREETAEHPLRQAVTRALERTGSTVSSAGLILAGTFGAFALVSESQPGGGMYTSVLASLAIGILMDAFLVRTLLVPSAVALLGRWNWWPSIHGAPAQAALAPEPGPDHKRLNR
jgi:RND superfamily putative drug exporter